MKGTHRDPDRTHAIQIYPGSYGENRKYINKAVDFNQQFQSED